MERLSLSPWTQEKFSKFLKSGDEDVHCIRREQLNTGQVLVEVFLNNCFKNKCRTTPTKQNVFFLIVMPMKQNTNEHY